ncbi:MAG: hypothetical protein IT368_06455 [Candidatus Hydrogenedentes bacterium]|nr:hypothetical protein [Candidatus Hydrogenedentota bacterium]
MHLLLGQSGPVFSMYGTPGDLESFRQLVSVMQKEQLGNAFDPGPGPHPGMAEVFDYCARLGWPVICYPGGDMQVVGGRGPLGPENRKVLAPMDEAGVFAAIQLGEWGYYFHNLSCNEPWFRANFGSDYESYRHLMKPPGLAGYDQMPKSRRECYEVLRHYFTTKSNDLLNRIISVTGHSHYEAYVGEWGAECIGLELGENIAFTQSKIAFARGASRRWEKPWSVQVSPWFHGACTTSGPLRGKPGETRGLDAGHSLSFYERLWLHSWFAGAAMVTPENSSAIFFEAPEEPWTLTDHGKKASEVFRFMQSHARGIPYTPVAIVIDHLAGYNGYMDKPWGILPPTEGDRELRDLFDMQLFPGSDHIHTGPDKQNPEAAYLRATPYGEMFDVLLSNAPSALLSEYRVLLLAGDLEFTPGFCATLEAVLQSGTQVLIAERHRAALGDHLRALESRGRIEVLKPWINPATQRPAAIADERLRELCQELLPLRIEGDPVQFQMNRLPNGWVVELVNNNGVAKRPAEPAEVDPAAVARVVIEPAIDWAAAHEWRSGKTHTPPDRIQVEIGPGSVAFVELTEGRPGEEAVR